VLAAIHAVVSISWRADQIVSGTAIWFLGLGLTGYLFVDIYGAEGTPGDIPGIPDVSLGFLDDVPYLGEAFGDLNLMIWLAFLAVIVSYFVVFRTPFGLRLRSVGEHPRAAETVGLSVYRIRYSAVIISGMLAGLGGAFLSIGELGLFREQMTAGRGFLAFAAVIFGAWRPAGVLAACWIFGAAEALQLRLQAEATVPQGVWLAAGVLAIAYLVWIARAGTPQMRRPGNVAVAALALAGAVALFAIEPAWSFPSQVWLALPYVLTLLALAGVVGKVRAPKALGLPYNRVEA
jgi:general nucleoside transport system permease protein